MLNVAFGIHGYFGGGKKKSVIVVYVSKKSINDDGLQHGFHPKCTTFGSFKGNSVHGEPWINSSAL